MTVVADHGSRGASTDDDPAAVLAARARALATPHHDARPARVYLALRVGPHRFGVSVERARQVAGVHHRTPVPGAPDAILGAASVLGRLVAVADLGELVGVTPQRAVEERQLVVVGEDDDALGLLVDEVEGLAEIDADAVPSHEEVVHLTGPTTDGLRLLHVDALVTDPRVSPAHSSPTAFSGGQP